MFKKKIKNVQLFLLLIIYTISHIFFYTNIFYINFFKPFFWLFFLTIFYQKDGDFFKKKEINTTLAICVIFFILYIGRGFILGFNKSLANFSLINILLNVWNVFLPIYGIEVVRYKLLKSNKNYLGFRILLTIVIILSEINFKALFLSHSIIFFHYFSSIVIPIIFQNFLFTYLSLNGGDVIPIIIKLFNELPKFILPIVPYSNWFIEGSLAIIEVLLIYYLFKYFIFSKKTINHYTNLGIVLCSLSIIISILLVLFMLGLFTYKPIAILSNSMNPTFKRGDVVIYKKDENIFPGDIIVFQYQNQIIVHRVVGINEYYVTKGDANKSVDYIKVEKEDIKGVYQFSLKYLGYPSIWLNELFTKES